jgi:uncharacterized protein YndB with AHSA1/START domain
MSNVDLVIEAPADAIWAVLADARSYNLWVVGAKEIRDVEGPWPQPGSKFHHTLGMGPFTLHDNTKSLASQEPRHLAIEARARPLGRAHVEFRLEPIDGGTRVTVEERFVSPRFVTLLNPLIAPLIRRRNVKTLDRLANVVRTSAAT